MQACRGGNLADTVEVEADGDDEEEDSMDWGGYSIITQELPLHKDFLLAYSAPPGLYTLVCISVFKLP